MATRNRLSSASWTNPTPEAVEQMAQSIVDVFEVGRIEGIKDETIHVAVEALRDSAQKSTTEWYIKPDDK